MADTIRLTWTDRATTEDGYYVYRSATKAHLESAALLASGATYRIATLAADAATYDDTGFTEDVANYYRVAAYQGSTQRFNVETVVGDGIYEILAVGPPDVTQGANLVNWWKMDEGSGTTAADAGTTAATASNLTLIAGGTWGSGPFDSVGGVILDGTDSYLESGTFDLALTDAFSVSFWVKSNDPSTTIYTYGYRAFMEYSYNPTAYMAFIIGTFTTSDSTQFVVGAGSGVDAQYATNPVTDVTTWHNYVFTWADGSPTRQYVDGVLMDISTTTLTGDIGDQTVGYDWAANDELRIGRRSDWPIRTMNCEFSDARIYDIRLSDGGVAEGETATGDVAAIYNSGAGDRS